MYEFVSHMVLLVGNCKRIFASLRKDSIVFFLGDDAEVCFDMQGPRVKSFLRAMIANLVAFSTKHGAEDLNVYGDKTVISFSSGNYVAVTVRIDFSNTLREQRFCIERVQ
jgi:hypothetical protein